MMPPSTAVAISTRSGDRKNGSKVWNRTAVNGMFIPQNTQANR